MSKADEVRAKAKRAAERKAAATKTGTPVTREQGKQNTSPAAAPAAPHTKPVRSTVDLSPTQHASLASWRGQTAIEIGRSRVTTQDVFRALVDRLLSDDELAQTIARDLQERD